MLRRTLLLALLVAVGRVAGAQPAVGSEFRVNTYTTAHQYLPAVAADAEGNFVVVWSSYPQPDGTKTGVFGQRFDHRGNMRGSEFAVSTFTNGYQYDIFNSVAMHPSGSFVVTWTDGYGQDGSYYGIFGQRYDASGNPAGPQFQVNASATDYQIQSDVAYSATGNFVVVWASFGQDGSYYGVFGRRFDGAGNPLGSEFQVNTYTPGSQWWP